MRIPTKPPSTSAAKPVGGTRKAGGVDATQASGAVGNVASSSGVGSPLDVAEIMGLSPADLSPKVQAAMQRLFAEVAEMREELQVARKRIKYLENLADTDVLTPVLNRRAFVRELGQAMAYSERYDVPGAILFIDVNGMKYINDSYGHDAGDLVIQHVAELLMNNIRSTDYVGRLGGDEFGIILLQANSEVAARKAAELTELVEPTPLLYQEAELQVHVAIGIQIFSGVDADAALRAADQAMYQQKKAQKATREDMEKAREKGGDTAE